MVTNDIANILLTGILDKLVAESVEVTEVNIRAGISSEQWGVDAPDGSYDLRIRYREKPEPAVTTWSENEPE